MSYPRRSVSGLSRIEYRPMTECEWAVLKHKKGEKYVEWNFKFPFKHVKEYQEDLYIDKYWFGFTEHYYTESSLLKDHVMIIDGKAYNMCKIHEVFLDGSDKYEYFPDDECGLERYNYLCNKFGLELLDNDN